MGGTSMCRAGCKTLLNHCSTGQRFSSQPESLKWILGNSYSRTFLPFLPFLSLKWNGESPLTHSTISSGAWKEVGAGVLYTRADYCLRYTWWHRMYIRWCSYMRVYTCTNTCVGPATHLAVDKKASERKPKSAGLAIKSSLHFCKCFLTFVFQYFANILA